MKRMRKDVRRVQMYLNNDIAEAILSRYALPSNRLCHTAINQVLAAGLAYLDGLRAGQAEAAADASKGTPANFQKTP